MASEKIERLEKQRDKLNAKLQRERNKEAAEERKRDTRRMILTGRMVWANAKKSVTTATLLDQLDDYLTEQRDRKLFGLPEKTTQGSEVQQSSHPNNY